MRGNPLKLSIGLSVKFSVTLGMDQKGKGAPARAPLSVSSTRRRGYPRQPRQNTRHLTIMSNIQTAETQGKPEFAHGSANLLDRWKLFRIVNRDSGLSSGARRVAFELLDGSFAVKHHPTQRYTKLTVKQVAALTGLHRNNVAAGFDNLIDRGYFTVLSQGHTGHARERIPATKASTRAPSHA